MEVEKERPTFPSLKEADAAHTILQKIINTTLIHQRDNTILIDGWVPLNKEELAYIRKIAAELS